MRSSKYAPFWRLTCAGGIVLLGLLKWPSAVSARSQDGVRYANVASAAQIVVLPDSRVLATDFGTDNSPPQVVETDLPDHLLWRYTGQLSNPHSAYPVGSGNVLIADTGNNRVIEVDHTGRIIWNTDDLGGC